MNPNDLQRASNAASRLCPPSSLAREVWSYFTGPSSALRPPTSTFCFPNFPFGVARSAARG
jgi:hypothetical protein